MSSFKIFSHNKITLCPPPPPPPKHVILNVKRKILEFIWNTKRPKVKYQILIKDYDGGIKLPDIELHLQTQRVLWAKRLLTGDDNILNSYLDCT